MEQLSVTLIIIIVTSIVSYIGFNNPLMSQRYMLHPYTIFLTKDYQRFISSAFLHANMMHLFFNMFSLYLIGESVEWRFVYFFGKSGYLFYFGLYTFGILSSSIFEYFKYRKINSYASIGASGAVSAVVFSFIVLTPNAKFYSILPAWMFGILYLYLSYYMDKKGGTGVAHGAHLFGAIGGLVFTILIFVITGNVDFIMNTWQHYFL